MSSKPKDIILRAFRISIGDTEVSNAVNIFDDLKVKLGGSESSSNRCMILNPTDPNNEKDLISDYHEVIIPKSFFCTMLRIVPGEDAQHIPDELLEQKKFSMDEVEELQESHNLPNLCKESFYFSTCGHYLVTNLRGNKTIKDLQTYLSWLLGNDLLILTPMVNIPDDIPMQDISNITFSDGYIDSSFEGEVVKTQSSQTRSFNLKNMAASIIDDLFGDTQDLSDIDLERIIEANLIVKWSKPKDMSKEEYEKVMGAMIKPVADLEGMTIKPKKGRLIRGEEIPKTKVVKVAHTSSGKIVEMGLQQEMSKFLNELNQSK